MGQEAEVKVGVSKPEVVNDVFVCYILCLLLLLLQDFVLLSELLILSSKVVFLPLDKLIEVLEVDFSPLDLVLQHADLIFVLGCERVHFQLHLLPERLASNGILGQLLLKLCSGNELLLISQGLPPCGLELLM
ncbi:hypothetical protein ACOSQ3_028828 [Xanthoceras sorbifolium]